MNQFNPDATDSIHKMLNPSSIAVVGATERPQYGGRFLRSIMWAGDKVRVYPVNPRYEEVLGMRCYASVRELPESPDLVAVIVPYDRVMAVLEESAQIGAGSAIVISAGFSERGDASRAQAQQEMRDFCRRTGLRVCGPNCLGVANVRTGVWATASTTSSDLKPSPVALVSHSGATAFGPLMTRAMEIGLGFSHIVSTGNEVDLESSDFIGYLLEDPEVKVVACFIEGFKDGRKLLEVARRALELDKRIVLIKVGKSEVGSKAALSHTAALTGSDAVHDAAFRQYGVVRADDWDELLQTAHLLAYSPAPTNDGVVVVSHSGGVSSMIADHLGQAGLELPPLTSEAREGISEVLGGFGWSANPADVTVFANRDEFSQIMDLLEREPEAGSMVVATFGTHQQVEQVKALRGKSKKPILFVTTGGKDAAEGLAGLTEAHIPVFYSPQIMAKSLSGLVEYARRRRAWLDEGKRADEGGGAIGTVGGLPPPAGQTLSEFEAKRLLEGWGVPPAQEKRAHSEDEAARAALAIGFPVAVKLDSPQVLHKTEAGAVRLNLGNEAAVRDAYQEVTENGKNYAPESEGSPVLVQEMVMGGVEVIVGIGQDPQFGPVLVFGLGGTLVELFDDVAMRVCPITEGDAWEMVREVKAYRLLTGFRGAPEADVEAVVATLMAVSNMAQRYVDRAPELDINPLMVLPKGQGVKAVDALLRFGK